MNEEISKIPNDLDHDSKLQIISDCLIKAGAEFVNYVSKVDIPLMDNRAMLLISGNMCDELSQELENKIENILNVKIKYTSVDLS